MFVGSKISGLKLGGSPGSSSGTYFRRIRRSCAMRRFAAALPFFNGFFALLLRAVFLRGARRAAAFFFVLRFFVRRFLPFIARAAVSIVVCV